LQIADCRLQIAESWNLEPGTWNLRANLSDVL
jgi:hypothetical protein